MKCVGVVDTTFARVDMASPAVEVLKSELPGYAIVRHTVPGIKDIPGAARRVLDKGCEGVITLGWVGRSPVDKYSYLAASIGLIMLEVFTGKIIIDVTVHEDEVEEEALLKPLAIKRSMDHAANLAKMIKGGMEALTPRAGKGVRQGTPDVGPL